MKTTVSAIVVEDDAEIGALISRYLEANNFTVTLVETGAALDEALATQGVDLIILDINLPGEDGLSICRRIRAGRSTPIIIVSAQGDDVDKIVGLEMGADDYVAKPFNPRELLARIRAVLRRSTDEAPRSSGQVYRFAGWNVNVSAREVTTPGGTRVAVTAAEFDLLYALCEHPNRVLSRDQLIGLTHGRVDGPAERSIDTLISRLRQKLEPDAKNPLMIQTVRSEGYIFAAQVARR